MKIILIALLLCLTSLTAFPQDAQSTAVKVGGRLTPAQEKLIKDTFTYLNTFWADQGKSLSQNMTEKYFDPATTLIINGKTVYTGYAQFNAHFKEVSKHIRGKILFPLLEMMSIGNKIILNFKEDIYDNNGNYYPANVMAIITLYKDRIQQWEEVVNSKYFCQPEAEKTVYSN